MCRRHFDYRFGERGIQLYLFIGKINPESRTVMAINKNHEFEDLNGVKCAIVEKNVKPERVAFLKDLLEYNHFTVIIAASPPPKVAAPVAPKEEEPAAPPPPPVPETFTV